VKKSENNFSEVHENYMTFPVSGKTLPLKSFWNICSNVDKCIDAVRRAGAVKHTSVGD